MMPSPAAWAWLVVIVFGVSAMLYGLASDRDG